MTSNREGFIWILKDSGDVYFAPHASHEAGNAARNMALPKAELCKKYSFSYDGSYTSTKDNNWSAMISTSGVLTKIHFVEPI
jgi:hypothetical protein